MKNLRFWLVILCVWMFGLYNLERWNESINLASFIYIYTIMCVGGVLLVGRFQRVSVHWILLAALVPYFLLKRVYGYPLGGPHLPITIAEISTMWITILIARQVGLRVSEFQEALSELVQSKFFNGTHTFDTGQGLLYREIRRARLYERPATLISIALTGDSAQASLNHLIQKAQKEMATQFICAQIAKLLAEELPDCDVIAQRDDHFIILMPEISGTDANEIVAKLMQSGMENLGIAFKVGVATFPEEAVTLESLLEMAETNMNRAPSDDGVESPIAPANLLPRHEELARGIGSNN